jgi:hypothetical protein
MPLRVPANLVQVRIIAPQHHAGLRHECLRVGLYLCLRDERTQRISPGRVANTGGNVSHEEEDFVSQVLQLAHHPQVDRVPNMQMGRGQIYSVFDAQLSP